MFSIIIPLYNKEKHIKDTLDSVWAQSFTDFEVIVVNDGSTDKSLEIIQSINDERLQLFSIKNQGVSHARNYGISKANSDLIVFLDADDLWLEHHLQDLKELYEEFPNCGLYCKAYDKIKGKTIITSNYKDIPRQKKWKGVIKDYFYHSSINSLASSSSIAIPKFVFESVGAFNENFNSGEDTDMWIRIALKYPTAFDNTVSVLHNLNAYEKQTNTTLKSRTLFDLNAYHKSEAINKSLKKYLDLNRYTLAIQYKLESETKSSKAVYQQIDKNNLNTLQKILFGSPKTILQFALDLRNFLRTLKINLRLFR